MKQNAGINGRGQWSVMVGAGVIIAVLCGCGASRLPLPKGGIRLTCDSPDVLVYINDRLVGQCGQLSGKKGFGLGPGTYRIEARRKGCFVQYELVSVGDAIVDVNLSPRKIPPQTL